MGSSRTRSEANAGLGQVAKLTSLLPRPPHSLRQHAIEGLDEIGLQHIVAEANQLITNIAIDWLKLRTWPLSTTSDFLVTCSCQNGCHAAPRASHGLFSSFNHVQSPLHLCDTELALLRVVARVHFSLSSLRFPMLRGVLSAAIVVHCNAFCVFRGPVTAYHSFCRCSAAALFISHAIPPSRTPPTFSASGPSALTWLTCCPCNHTARSSGLSATTHTFSHALL